MLIFKMAAVRHLEIVLPQYETTAAWQTYRYSFSHL